MNQEMQNNLLIEKYLLGELSPPECEQIEQRYFTDRDFLEQVDAVEGDLIEDYALGMLSEEKMRKVRTQLLNSPYQSGKVKSAEALLRSIDESAVDKVAVVPPVSTRESWWNVMPGFFRFQTGWRLVTVAAAVLLLVIGLVEIVRLRRQLEKARQEQTALLQQKQGLQNTIAEQRKVIDRLTVQPQIPPPGQKDQPKKESTPPPPQNHFATFISPLLFTGARTAQGELQEMALSREFETVRLRLFYDGENRPPFRAVLENSDRQQLWPKEGLPPKYDLPASRFGKGKKIEVDLPASLLEDKTYTVTLKVKTASGEEDVSHYTFNVRRQ